MRATATAIMALAFLFLATATAAGEDSSYDDEFDVEKWDYADIRVDVGDRQKMDIRISFTVPEDTDNTTSHIDIYLLTEDQLEQYEANSSFDSVWEKQYVSSVNSFYTHYGNATTWYLIIDNTDNSRGNSEEALPGKNGTVTISLHYTLKDLPPPIVPPTDDDPTDASDPTMFAILAAIVLGCFLVIGLAVRRRTRPGTGSGAEPSEEEEEDYFGRVRIG